MDTFIKGLACTVITLVLTGTLSWFALQVITMRDDIKDIKHAQEIMEIRQDFMFGDIDKHIPALNK